MVTVLNADSIYSTSYSALSLTLSLKVKGYYDNKDTTLIPVSEVGTFMNRINPELRM